MKLLAALFLSLVCVGYASDVPQEESSEALPLPLLEFYSPDWNQTQLQEEAGAVGDANSQKALLDRINFERARRGLRTVCLNSKLTKAAQLHTDDMARSGIMSHSGTDGSTPKMRILRQKFQYSKYGETVAAGQTSVTSVMNAWMNSKGHHDIIMDPLHRFVGPGYAYSSKRTDLFRHYWTLDFGNSGSEACDPK
ncbi:hypothetical protein Poli38472_008360 [Pythium oligandrum]|uniref:SCP domain-containing protein n=1 Tax=Pythium oligandrum TaxID=41045 RepID=A0A8K1CMP1_PYTOL|nr:hypothetical protein Poli38472_008360 [Pythium oligandrum]|eukprot:TMW65718.1 hypothetical protein Poli38472_008360 [Pythium oligandrum]